jgi:hypothetical protein
VIGFTIHKFASYCNFGHRMFTMSMCFNIWLCNVCFNASFQLNDGPLLCSGASTYAFALKILFEQLEVIIYYYWITDFLFHFWNWIAAWIGSINFVRIHDQIQISKLFSWITLVDNQMVHELHHLLICRY